jgi:hypothetical protein
MKRILLRLMMVSVISAPGLANSAVTEEDFLVKTTSNLINLCTASPQDRLYGDAVNFCQGYMVGAYHYFIAEHSKDPKNLFVCLPDPKPSRNEVVAMFVAWAKSNPQSMTDMPVESQFRFMSEKWPCK